jgi:ribonuclease-3
MQAAAVLDEADIVQHAPVLTHRFTAAQAAVAVAPTYRTVAPEGPSHEPTFVAEALLAGLSVGTGRGRTKKAAEQEAARMALEAWPAIEPAVMAAVATPADRE